MGELRKAAQLEMSNNPTDYTLSKEANRCKAPSITCEFGAPHHRRSLGVDLPVMVQVCPLPQLT